MNATPVQGQQREAHLNYHILHGVVSCEEGHFELLGLCLTKQVGGVAGCLSDVTVKVLGRDPLAAFFLVVQFIWVLNFHRLRLCLFFSRLLFKLSNFSLLASPIASARLLFGSVPIVNRGLLFFNWLFFAAFFVKVSFYFLYEFGLEFSQLCRLFLD